jgi:MraZ protein
VAAQPFRFSGQGFSLQGDKGRFVLPSHFRKSVKEASGGDKIICLDKHDRWPCLTAFGTSRRDELPAELEREEERAVKRGEDFDYDKRSMELGGFFEIPFDESGRFVLPRHLPISPGLAIAPISTAPARFISIWAPDKLNAMGAGWEVAQASCRHLAAEAAARERKA